MVIKSKLESEHINDLGNIFKILKRHKLQLNASKCFFGVESGKFLGYMVTHCGIEVNPDQIKAINNLHPPRNPKNVQKITRMIAALNRFNSRSIDRCRPFFFFSSYWTSGRDLNGLRSVSWPSSSWRNTYLNHPLCPDSRWMRFCLLTLPWLPMRWSWCLYKSIVVYRGQFIR